MKLSISLPYFDNGMWSTLELIIPEAEADEEGLTLHIDGVQKTINSSDMILSEISDEA